MIQNRLGISDPLVLAREEERISKRAAISLYRSGVLTSLEAGSFTTLVTIHERLFGELYDFAGKVRTVNLAKGNFRFASALYLESAVKSVEKMPQSSFSEIVEKYVEMNVPHPFREGNGRSMRIWLDHMLRIELHTTVDWSKIDREDYLLAMERSPVRDTEIKALVFDALTDQLEDITLLARGIDASYAYEGYAAYRTAEL